MKKLSHISLSVFDYFTDRPQRLCWIVFCCEVFFIFIWNGLEYIYIYIQWFSSFWTRLFAFHMAFILLGKVYIQLLSFKL